MQTGRRPVAQMGGASAVVFAVLLMASVALVCHAADAKRKAPTLSGKTLSAVVYVRRPARMAGPGELARFMFQAYLQGDGRALVRVWDTARDSYTGPNGANWALSRNTLCLDLPAGPGRICADVHIWGPRIAGIGVNPYVMLDGDLTPGNAIMTAR